MVVQHLVPLRLDTGQFERFTAPDQVLSQLCRQHRLVFANVQKVFVHDQFLGAGALVLIGGYDYWIANADIMKLGRHELRRRLQVGEALPLRRTVISQV